MNMGTFLHIHEFSIGTSYGGPLSIILSMGDWKYNENFNFFPICLVEIATPSLAKVWPQLVLLWENAVKSEGSCESVVSGRELRTASMRASNVVNSPY